MDRNRAETVNLISSGGREVQGNILAGLRDMGRRFAGSNSGGGWSSWAEESGLI